MSEQVKDETKAGETAPESVTPDETAGLPEDELAKIAGGVSGSHKPLPDSY